MYIGILGISQRGRERRGLWVSPDELVHRLAALHSLPSLIVNLLSTPRTRAMEFDVYRLTDSGGVVKRLLNNLFFSLLTPILINKYLIY